MDLTALIDVLVELADAGAALYLLWGFTLVLRESIRNDRVAADDGRPGGPFLLQVGGKLLRGVEHRNQRLMLELLREPW